MADPVSSTSPKFTDVRFIVAMVITAIYVASYVLPYFAGTTPTLHDMQVTFQSASQTAFVAAWSYYLGNSSSAAQRNEQVGKALDLAAGAQPDPTAPQPVKVVNATDDPVPTEEAKSFMSEPVK